MNIIQFHIPNVVEQQQIDKAEAYLIRNKITYEIRPVTKSKLFNEVLIIDSTDLKHEVIFFIGLTIGQMFARTDDSIRKKVQNVMSTYNELLAHENRITRP